MFLYERSPHSNAKNGEKNTYHYKTKETSTFMKFTYGGEVDHGIMVFNGGVEKIYLSTQDAPGTHIDLYPMKVLATNPNPNFEFPYDFHVTGGFEVWTVDFIDKQGDDGDSKGYNFDLSEVIESKNMINTGYSYWSLSGNKVYDLPSSLTAD